MDGTSLLLLEEPELSLNEGIVQNLPRLIRRFQSQAKTPRQVFITTHSEALLSDQSIGADEVLRLVTTANGTEIKPPDPHEEIMLQSGLSVGDVLLPSIKPAGSDQLHLALGS
jgi:predicted ATP-dependent endonuclease of OLD family